MGVSRLLTKLGPYKLIYTVNYIRNQIMAKVNVEYDTVAKTADVTIDGKRVENLSNMSVYCGYDTNKDGTPRFAMDLGTHEHDKEHDMHKMNMVRASLKAAPEPDIKKCIA